MISCLPGAMKAESIAMPEPSAEPATMSARRFQRGDVVYIADPETTWSSRAIIGRVKRSARNGTWVDVLWRTGYATWTTRMRAQMLTLKEARKQTRTEAAHDGH